MALEGPSRGSSSEVYARWHKATALFDSYRTVRVLIFPHPLSLFLSIFVSSAFMSSPLPDVRDTARNARATSWLGENTPSIIDRRCYTCAIEMRLGFRSIDSRPLYRPMPIEVLLIEQQYLRGWLPLCYTVLILIYAVNGHKRRCSVSSRLATPLPFIVNRFLVLAATGDDT